MSQTNDLKPQMATRSIAGWKPGTGWAYDQTDNTNSQPPVDLEALVRIGLPVITLDEAPMPSAVLLFDDADARRLIMAALHEVDCTPAICTCEDGAETFIDFIRKNRP